MFLVDTDKNPGREPLSSPGNYYLGARRNGRFQLRREGESATASPRRSCQAGHAATIWEAPWITRHMVQSGTTRRVVGGDVQARVAEDGTGSATQNSDR